jgi:hypothetical protein
MIKKLVLIFFVISACLVFIAACSQDPQEENQIFPHSGKIIFAEIPQLPKNWWNDHESVWEIWDKETYYLWGANLRNYVIKDPAIILKGSGMASINGPTRGRGHAHYVGVITTALENYENDKIFTELESKLRNGSNIVIPVINGRFGLGTGVAFLRHSSLENWYRSQKHLLEEIIRLSSVATEVDILEGTYWPDCGITMNTKTPIAFPIKSVSDIEALISYLNSKIVLQE